MTESVETAASPMFTRVKQTEIIYHLNGHEWTAWTMSELMKQIEEDGFPPEAEIQVDHKNKNARVISVQSL